MAAAPGTRWEIVDRLTRYAEESDSEALDYIESVRDELASLCDREYSEKLETSIRAYDFTAALDVLKLLPGSGKVKPIGENMMTATEKRATILIVDDSPDSVALLSSLLKDTYRVKVAITGEKALAIAAGEEPPDLILLDIMMPGMDGYEACRRLKQNPTTAAIPVIFLTAKSETMDEEKGFELGAEDYIAKPPALPS